MTSLITLVRTRQFANFSSWWLEMVPLVAMTLAGDQGDQPRIGCSPLTDQPSILSGCIWRKLCTLT